MVLRCSLFTYIVTWKQVIIETFSSLKYASSSENQHNNYQLIVLISWTRNVEQDTVKRSITQLKQTCCFLTERCVMLCSCFFEQLDNKTYLDRNVSHFQKAKGLPNLKWHFLVCSYNVDRGLWYQHWFFFYLLYFNYIKPGLQKRGKFTQKQNHWLWLKRITYLIKCGYFCLWFLFAISPNAQYYDLQGEKLHWY